VSRGLAAVTGATGFLGQHIVRALADDGWRVRILARRDPISPFWQGVTPEVVAGDLGDEAALTRLCRGADLVVHAAGLIAGDPRDLQRVNVEGARRLATAATAASQAHVVLISSLAAREPHLSPYAGSKAAGEAIAREILSERLTIVRPPAVYGPGDRETLKLFQLAEASPVLPVLGVESRLALVHAADAAGQIAWLSTARPAGPVALCDARPEGYGWREIMHTAAAAFGRARSLIRIPAGALYVAASAETFSNVWRPRKAVLTFGKVKELTHLDWGVRSDERAVGAPAPEYGLLPGFEQTIGWYRSQGWLRAQILSGISGA
jgi:nucleoside-diphosphate-sugar epimerase